MVKICTLSVKIKPTTSIPPIAQTVASFVFYNYVFLKILNYIPMYTILLLKYYEMFFCKNILNRINIHNIFC